MRRLPLFVLLAAGVAGCPQPNNRPDATLPDVSTQDRVATDTARPDGMSMPDGSSMPDATSMPDGMSMPDGSSMPDGMSMPDAASGPSAQIRAVQLAAAGAVDLPIDGVLVTYVVPAITGATVANDPAGFAVQADPTGPALFVAVDPTTLTPSPAVGDRVSFRVTMTRSLNGGASRWASAVSGYMRMSGSNPVAALTQDLSNSADIVSALGSYEYELIQLTGSVTGAATNAGAAFQSFTITTAGIPAGDANLRVRMPQDLVNMLGVRAGCRITVGPTPLWRFTAQAQPSAWRASDIMLSGCPAAMDAGPEAGVDAAVDARTDTGVDAATDSGVRLDAGADAARDASMGDACVARIVINEVQSRGNDAMGTLGASNEFVELFNAGSCAVDLNGWSLGYISSAGTGSASVKWTQSTSLMLPAGGYAVVSTGSVTIAATAVRLTATSATTLGLADTGGVGLLNGMTLVDSVTWEQSAGGIAAGHPYTEMAATSSGVSTAPVIIARVPNGSDTNNNRTDFVQRTTSSAGAANM